MMERLFQRGEELAREAQRRGLQRVAQKLKELLRGAAIEIGEAQVLVSGRGIVKRWLINPALRFFSGELK